MPTDPIADRIRSWREAGLIDAATADRLRDYESSTGAVVADGSARDALSFFGPAPSVTEAFVYLGLGFVLAAVYVLVSSQLLEVESWQKWAAATAGIAAVATVAGAAIRRRGPRFARAAGVLLAVAVANAGVAVYNAIDPIVDTEVDRLVLAAIAAVAAAAVLRVLHPSLPAQASLIGAIIVLAGALSGWTEQARLEGLAIDLAIWIVASILTGALVLVERPERLVDSARRVAMTRFAAGTTVVIAAAAILTRSEYDFVDGGRILEPWIAELGIVVISLAVLALAIRRGSTAYLYPAALGIVIALTDANGAYIADQAGTGVALLIEGIVLLVAGFGADRLRRWLGRRTRPDGPVAAGGGSSA